MFAHLTIPETLWDRVGDHLATLRSAGVTVPFADALIATVAIENGIALWTRDSHFATIQNTLPPFHCLLSRRKAGRSLPGRVCSSDSEPSYGHPVGAPWE